MASNFRYDHPLYLIRGFDGTNIGALGAYRFAAFTDMIVKSVTIRQIVAGTTAAQVFTAYKYSGTNTTTTVLTTIGTGVYGTYANTTALATLANGDAFGVVNAGTDATAIYALGVEMAYVPGASVN